MTVLFLIGLSLGALALALLNSSFFLWIAARLARAPVRFRRCLWIALPILAAGILLRILSEGAGAMFLLLAPVLLVASLVLYLRAFLPARWGQTCLILSLFLGLNLLVGMPLAFVLKQKVLESFVLRGDAMAPAVMGPHVEMVCGECGLDFPAAISSSAAEADPLPDRNVGASCPNCGGKVPVSPESKPQGADRLLVDKFRFPRRWDIAVFRSPGDPGRVLLMRLVGLPGETVAIAGGEVFIDGKLSRKPSGPVPGMWIPVADTAFRSRDPARAAWKPEMAPMFSGWSEVEPGGWAFRREGTYEEPLLFTREVTDHVAYSVPASPAFAGPRPVRDIKVECAVAAFRGQGRWGLDWEHGGLRVEARMSGQMVDLDAKWATASSTGAGSTSNRLERALDGKTVAFSFRDGEASVAVGGKPIATLKVGPQDLESASPPPEGSPPRIAIIGAGCELLLSRIQVFRDVHYEGKWLRHLGPRDLFFLGDNSRVSADSRYRGTVPPENVVGTVRWTFWPPGRVRAFTSSDH